MDTYTISEGFRAQVPDTHKVVAAVFTTYNFEPDFFEQEIVPLLLDQSLAYSSDQRIKSLQVREALGAAGLPIEVFYDVDMFRQQGTVSPAMEYLHHGVRGERRAFHAKLVFVLLEDEATQERLLLVGAGSANLTSAGWWQNVECQHWERVVSGETPRRFINQLSADVSWLDSRRQGQSAGALAEVAEFLRNCRSQQYADPISYYGLSSLSIGQQRRPAFFKFLMDAKNERCSYYKKWSLDIISPYFAEGDQFDGHETLLRDLGVHEIRIFLPINEQGEALCRSAYYKYVDACEGVHWSDWNDKLNKVLGLNGSTLRRTHAKIYHLYNGQQSWVFVGSVNFTRYATGENQEAGFFTKLASPQGSFLKPVTAAPEKWCSEEALSGDDGAKDLNERIPDIRFTYNWKTRTFTGLIADARSAELTLWTPEKAILADSITLTDQIKPVDVDPDIVESVLNATGFLRIEGVIGKHRLPSHLVIVQQTNWSHKPLDLPRLSPQEIMQIYAGLNQFRRNEVIQLLKEEQLRYIGMSGEFGIGNEYEAQGRQFFAEYAELFHAFRCLRQRLRGAYESESWNTLDYYLSGRGMDSLPSLLDSLADPDKGVEPTTKYLTLLSLVQIYGKSEYQCRDQVAELQERCWDEITSIENSGTLKLMDDDAHRTARFYKWYKEQFFREYRVVETEEALDATS